MPHWLSSLAVIAAIAGVAWVWFYADPKWIRPYGRCRWCKGTGKMPLISTKYRWNYCPVCHGKPRMRKRAKREGR